MISRARVPRRHVVGRAGTPLRTAVGLALCLAVTLFLAARRLGPMVIPVGLLGAAWAAMRRREQGRGRQVRRLRAWALHAPGGPSHASQFERVVVADLAATAGSDPRPFRGARAFVRHCVADPWRRELALERLAGVEATAASGAAPPHPTISPAAGCFWASALTVALAVALPLPRLLTVAVMTVTTLVAVLAWTELCDASAYVPQQLASTALLPPTPTRFVLPEPAVVDLLTELAGGDVALVVQAESVLDTVDTSEGTGRARARLEAARRALSRGCGSEARAVGLTPVDG